MATGTIKKELITKSFSHNFPAFSAGTPGTRVDYNIFDVAVDGYTPIAATLTPLYAGSTFGCFVSVNDTSVIITRNRLSGYAEPNPYNCTLKVLYQKNS